MNNAIKARPATAVDPALPPVLLIDSEGGPASRSATSAAADSATAAQL